jgi:hypothetical protein
MCLLRSCIGAPPHSLEGPGVARLENVTRLVGVTLPRS